MKKPTTNPANKEFRAELIKIMPGYEWTVHKGCSVEKMVATGIQTSGFNRLSTLMVTRTEKDGKAHYVAQSAGYGLRAPWLMSQIGVTLAQALRHLQDHYEHMASKYRGHAEALKCGRAKPTEGGDL